MDASKDKKEAPKGIIQSKNATFVHQSTSSSNKIILSFLMYYFISVKNCFLNRHNLLNQYPSLETDPLFLY